MMGHTNEVILSSHLLEMWEMLTHVRNALLSGYERVRHERVPRR
jgi:hypothetical protein